MLSLSLLSLSSLSLSLSLVSLSFSFLSSRSDRPPSLAKLGLKPTLIRAVSVILAEGLAERLVRDAKEFLVNESYYAERCAHRSILFPIFAFLSVCVQ